MASSSPPANKPILVANGVPKLHLINGDDQKGLHNGGYNEHVNGAVNGYKTKEVLNGSMSEMDPEMEAEKEYAREHPQEVVVPAPMPSAGDLDSLPKIQPGAIRRGKSFEGVFSCGFSDLLHHSSA